MLLYDDVAIITTTTTTTPTTTTTTTPTPTRTPTRTPTTTPTTLHDYILFRLSDQPGYRFTKALTQNFKLTHTLWI